MSDSAVPSSSSLDPSRRAARAGALRGHLAMLTFSFVVAGSFSLGSMVAGEISPLALTVLRFGFAGALLVGLAVVCGALGVAGMRGYRRADLAAPWRYLLLGGLYAGYFVLMFEALKITDPVSTGAVFTLTPLMTALIAWPLLGQRLRGWLVLALLIGALGAGWVIFRADLARVLGFDVGRGEAIFFVGCFLHALFTPLLKRFNRGEPSFVAMSLVMAAGGVLLVAFGWRELMVLDLRALPPIVWITLGYLAVFTTALSASLLLYAAQRLPSSKVMAYTYLTPAWIILWELALGHGGPNLMILPGVGLIVVALVMLLGED